MLFYEKNTQVVVRFRAQKLSWDNLTQTVFQSSLGRILMNWGLAEVCNPANRFLKRRNFWSCCSRKRIHRWLSDSELKKASWDNLTKTVFQSSLGINLLNWGLEEECLPPSRFWKRRFFYLVVLQKITQVVVRFRAQNVSWDNLTKTVFQSSLGLTLMNWGLAEECIPAKSFWKRGNFWSVFSTKKSTQVVLRFRAQKSVVRQFNEKCFSV